MLKNIDPQLNPRLLYLLATMGHGDRVAIVDRNYPAYASGVEVNHLGSLDSTQALHVVLSVMPLDRFEETPMIFMQPADAGGPLPVHQAALSAAADAEGRPIACAWRERHAFYEEVRTATVVIATDESRPWGNILLMKGVL
ncbi:L-fucose mutarotase [Agreia bicolorata]|uniref:L-fucose mutarotase n=1 Tax=Agreia bicolorata TaxID=110935 RepID=A0A1T4WWL2_9MICO|nr:RbsD/FucU domain-containing protein [Agreia bicolorata]KJC63636.1 hypothetical protein TZ00_14015 [Agreia bicolorata]SKA81706.1 L-fucose mutarotase [Agreia bicolorata]